MRRKKQDSSEEEAALFIIGSVVFLGIFTLYKIFSALDINIWNVHLRPFWWFAVFIFVLVIIAGYVGIVYKVQRKREAEAERIQHKKLVSVFSLRGYNISYREYRTLGNSCPKYEIPGIYIIHNTRKNKYYVGQSINVFRRIGQHFSGKGCRDIQADFLANDMFTIKIVALKDSGYDTLNSLEREAIWAYGTKYRLYNKTKGNAG